MGGPGSSAPAGTRAPYLRLDRVTKRFGAFTAVREISLDVYEGEFVCFLGPSGCGKTTMLNMIAGFDRPGTIDREHQATQSSGRLDEGEFQPRPANRKANRHVLTKRQLRTFRAKSDMPYENRVTGR